MVSTGSLIQFCYVEKEMTGTVVGTTKNGRYIVLSDSLFKKNGEKRKVMVGEKSIKLLTNVA
jgi:hypothetical protein